MRKWTWMALLTVLALSVGAAWGGTQDGKSGKTDRGACCCCTETCAK